MAELPNGSHTIEVGGALWRSPMNVNAQKYDPLFVFPLTIETGYGRTCAGIEMARLLVGKQQFKIKNARCSVETAGVTGTMTVDVLDDGASIFSTVMTVVSGATEDNNTAVLIDNPTIAVDSILIVDVTGIHSTPAVGLTVILDIEMLPNP